jgi:hypothetical protein
MKLITIKDLDAWKACCRGPGKLYSDQRLKRLLRGREGWTPLEISRMRSVSLEDRLWVLLRLNVLGIDLSRVCFAFASRAVRRHALHCRVDEIERWARRWLNAENRSQESAEWAKAKAWNYRLPCVARTIGAAIASIEVVRWVTIRSPMEVAIGIDPYSARAYKMARFFAAAAAHYTDYELERRWQLAFIRRVLREKDDNQKGSLRTEAQVVWEGKL